MRRPSSTAALIAVILWIVAGPIAAAFGACGAMGAMCEGPCGVGPCAITVLFTVMLVVLVLGLAGAAGRSVPAVLVRLVDPPPRSVLSF